MTFQHYSWEILGQFDAIWGSRGGFVLEHFWGRLGIIWGEFDVMLGELGDHTRKV